MEAIRGVLLVCVVLFGGCLSVDYTVCGDVYCATGEVCSPDQTQCVFPEQIEICAGQTDGSFCSYTGVPIGACTAGVCVSQTSGQLPAPTDLVASDGTSTDHVELTWATVDGATGYRVWRDSIAIADVTSPMFQDTAATSGGAPTTPSNLTASQGTSLADVQLGWSASTSADGIVHTYFVTALLDTLQSSPSPNDTGHRLAYAVTGYQVSLDAGLSFVDAGSGTTYSDATAPVGTWSATVAATDGVAGKVGLSFAGLAEVEMPRTYFVRAISGAGPSAAAMVTGYRDVGSPTDYQWQYSDAINGTYADLTGATAASHDDTTGPVITPRFYRCVLMGANGATAVLPPDSGWRGLEAPTNVAASDGTSTAQVSLTWSPVFGATGYRVYRDDVAISDVTATGYDDTGATAGAAPTTPGSLTASQGTSLADVQLAWSASTTANGTTHSYYVTALAGTDEGPQSVSDSGYRGAYPISGYEVSTDGGATYAGIGTVTSYTDAAAPVGTWSGNVAASDTTAGKVSLSVSGITEVFATVNYRVRAVNGAGPGGAASATGHRDVGSPTGFQWQRSDTATGTYADVTGGMTATFDDTTGPVAVEQFYRCVLTGANGATATLGPNPGTRGIESPTNLVASDGASPDHVALTWDAVVGATSYRVFRGGVAIQDVTTTAYNDTGAPAGGQPSTPTSFAATNGTHVDRVQLTWNASVSSAGSSQSYTVAAIVNTTVGPSSAANTGNRGPLPISYELQIDTGTFTNIGLSTSYADTAAPAGSYDATASASDGKAGTITLTLAATAVAGTARTYTLRAINTAGMSNTTTNTGYRASVLMPSVQWQRSAGTSDGSYADIVAATATPYEDTTVIPTFEPRWYRAIVSSPGTTSVTTAPDPGWRGLSTTAGDDLWIAGGRLSKGVRATAVGNGVLYIGGEFTYVGPKTGTFSKISAAGTGTVDLTWPRFTGEVNDVVSDGSGGWYVAGSITAVDGVTANRVVHVTSAGSVDATFAPTGINGAVEAIALSGGRVYIGGSFTTAGGQTRNNLAALDATTGALVAAWNPGADSTVLALAVVGSNLYIGGEFAVLGVSARSHLGAVDLTSGAVASWAPVLDGLVNDIQVLGATLYFGGNFQTIDGTSRPFLAAVDTTTGNLTPWNPAPNRGLRTMLVTASAVYVSGGYDTIGGTNRGSPAAVDVTNGAATSFNSTFTASASNVGSMTLIGNTLYMAFGGTTAGASGSSQPRANLAAVDVTTGTATVTSWNPGAADWLLDSVLVNDGTSVFVGSSVSSVGGVTRNNLAALDLATGEATSWNPDVKPTTTGISADIGIYTMALSGDGASLYIGGAFTSIGGSTRTRLTAVSTSTGAGLSWDPNANGTVRTIALNGTSVYAGGDFTAIGGQSRLRLAELNAVGAATTWNPGATHSVRALAISGGTVYAGGDFSSAGGQLRSKLVALDAGTGLATSWNPGASDPVRSLVVDGSTLWVGGAFTMIDGQTRSRIASFDMGTGSLTSWSGGGITDVGAILVTGNAVFYCGSGGVTVRDKLLPAPASAWSVTSPNSSTCSLSLDTSRLYAGGPGGPFGYAP